MVPRNDDQVNRTRSEVRALTEESTAMGRLDSTGTAPHLNHLDLEHGALHGVEELQALDHARLGQVHQGVDQIRNALAGDGGRGHHVDELAHVRVVPVDGGVEALGVAVSVEFESKKN
jgi:hypothetical protein